MDFFAKPLKFPVLNILAPLHFEPLFWEERFDWARRCPCALPGALKHLISLVFRKSEGGQAPNIPLTLNSHPCIFNYQ
jgi:hypothetical protein